MPFSDVTTAMIFSADDDTKRLFARTPPTLDDTGLFYHLYHCPNVLQMRWARPENIRILAPWSAVQAPGCTLAFVAPRKPVASST
jgi:hypothetical protein